MHESLLALVAPVADGGGAWAVNSSLGLDRWGRVPPSPRITVLQLADVAWPRVAHERLLHGRRDLPRLVVALPEVPLDEVVHQDGHVLAALAQRGQGMGITLRR